MVGASGRHSSMESSKAESEPSLSGHHEFALLLCKNFCLPAAPPAARDYKHGYIPMAAHISHLQRLALAVLCFSSCLVPAQQQSFTTSTHLIQHTAMILPYTRVGSTRMAMRGGHQADSPHSPHENKENHPRSQPLIPEQGRTQQGLFPPGHMSAHGDAGPGVLQSMRFSLLELCDVGDAFDTNGSEGGGDGGEGDSASVCARSMLCLGREDGSLGEERMGGGEEG
eukprot:3534536-Rhodomonas_salina.1